MLKKGTVLKNSVPSGTVVGKISEQAAKKIEENNRKALITSADVSGDGQFDIRDLVQAKKTTSLSPNAVKPANEDATRQIKSGLLSQSYSYYENTKDSIGKLQKGEKLSDEELARLDRYANAASKSEELSEEERKYYKNIFHSTKTMQSGLLAGISLPKQIIDISKNYAFPQQEGLPSSAQGIFRVASGNNIPSAQNLDRSALQKMIDQEKGRLHLSDIKSGYSLSAAQESPLLDYLYSEYFKTYSKEKDFENTPIMEKYQKVVNGIGEDGSSQVYRVRSEESAKILSYLDQKGLKKELKAYLKFLQYGEDEAENEIQKGLVAAKVSKPLDAVSESLKSVPENLIGGVLAEGSNVAQGAKNALGFGTGKINVYNDWHDLANHSINVRAAVNETIKSPLGQFAYQTGMSMADSALVAALGAGLQSIGLSSASKMATIPLASAAANQTTRSMLEEGYPAGQAFYMGIASGFAEYITEQYSLESLLKIGDSTTGKQLVKNIFKQAFAEGSEEVASNILNRIFEAAILGTQSHGQKAIQYYMEQGDSKEKAYFKVLRDYLYEDLIAAAGGFISGGLMGGAASVVNASIQSSKLGNTVLANGTDSFIMQQALALPKHTEAFRYASSLGGKYNQNQLGKTILLVNDYINSQKTERITEAFTKRALELGATKEQAKTVSNFWLSIQTHHVNEGEILRFMDEAKNTVGRKVLDEVLNPKSYGGSLQWVKDLNASLSEIEKIENGMTAALIDSDFWTNYAEKENAQNQNNFVANDSEVGYNTNKGSESYVRTDEFRSLQAESQGMSDEDIQMYHSGDRTLDDGLRERFSRSVKSILLGAADDGSGNAGRVLKLSAKDNEFNIFENVSGALFHDVFEMAHNYLKFGELVDLHEIGTTENSIGYEDCYNYLSEDGLSGFSITPDGDLISVFNASGKKGFLRAIANIVKEKAKTLDCYASSEQNLKEIYESIFGFQTASVMDYNMEYDHDNIAENHNMPQVAFMVNTDQQVEPRTFGENEYDEAVAYRDSFVEKATSENEAASFMPEDEESTITEPDITDLNQRAPVVRLAHALGYKILFDYRLKTKSGKIANGKIDFDNKTITINPNSKRGIQFILKHELSHAIEKTEGYGDFSTKVTDSNLFRDWMKKQGYDSLLDFVRDKMSLYDQAGESSEADASELERRAYREIVADFVGDILFNGDSLRLQNFLNTLGEQKQSFIDKIKGFFQKIKNAFSKDGRRLNEIDRLEKVFLESADEVIKNPAAEGGVAYSFKGYASDGKGMYESNFPIGTPKSAKAKVILDYIQNVWSKKPIKLNIEKGGETQEIYAQFDPSYDETGNTLSDATKLMGGNRHGTARDQRVTLDLADDYYRIAEESKYNYSKPETGKEKSTHKGVQQWHYFVNEIYFAEKGSDKYIPYTVTINVKEKTDGNFVYSFSAEKENDVAPQTLHAAVKGENAPNESFSIDSIPTSTENVKENSETDERFSVDDPIKIAHMPKKVRDLSGADISPKKGTNPAAGDGKSHFAESVKKSEFYTAEMKKKLLDDTWITSYKTITNKETLQKAAIELHVGGAEYVLDWMHRPAERSSVMDIAVGILLVQNYQTKGDTEKAIAAAEKLREFGTAQGQGVQLFSIISLFDPNTMIAYSQKTLDEAYRSVVEGKSKEWINANKDRFRLNDEDIAYIRHHVLEAALLPEGRMKAVLLAEISARVAEKIPPTKGDSLRALERISMLFNLKTQLRNIFGNLGMVPAFISSDFFGVITDKVMAKKTGVRTKGNIGLLNNTSGESSLQAAKRGLSESYDDFKRGINTKIEELNRFDTSRRDQIPNGLFEKNLRPKNFNEIHTGKLANQLNGVAKALNKLDNVVSFMLDAGDRPFYEMWFMNSLNNQLRLNHTVNPTEDMVKIAHNEALQRTWQDSNSFSNSVSALKHNLNNLGKDFKIGDLDYGLGDVVIKFTKTPSNIAKAILDFSPVGIAPLIRQINAMHKAMETGQFTAQMQADINDTFGKMMTGTLFYILIGSLLKLGWIKLHGKDDDDYDVKNFEKYVMGISPYSIEIGGRYYTYSWMMPQGAVLAAVADFMEGKDKPDTSAAETITNAISSFGTIFAQQSFLQNIQEALQYDDFVSGVVSLVAQAPSSFVPSLLTQTASATDPYERQTYIGYNHIIQNQLNSIIAKIPFARKTLQAKTNVLGEDVKNASYAASPVGAWQAFVNVANTIVPSKQEIAKDIYDVYHYTGDKSTIPPVPPTSYTFNGETVYLTGKGKNEFQKVSGAKTLNILNEVFKEKLSMEEKEEALKQVYNFSTKYAKTKRRYTDDQIAKMAKRSVDVIQKLSDSEKQRIIDDQFLSKSDKKHKEDDKALANYLLSLARKSLKNKEE